MKRGSDVVVSQPSHGVTGSGNVAQFVAGCGRQYLARRWATDEQSRPFLGYANKPLRVVALEGFTAKDFAPVAAESFDLLYLYSRKWESPDNWLARLPFFQKIQQRYFDYAPQIGEETLKARYGLKLVVDIERHGQWVRIYTK